VVIVTGAPPVFSAGADAPHARAKDGRGARRLSTEKKSQFRRLFERAQTGLENLEQATICMVNGMRVGGGWGLTLACDFPLRAAEAQFWIPEVDLACRSASPRPRASFASWAGARQGDHHGLPSLLGGGGSGARAFFVTAGGAGRRARLGRA